MPDLIAKSAYSYGGKRLKTGDPFTATVRDARTLTLVGRAIYATKTPAAEKPAAEIPARRAGYQRRDMTPAAAPETQPPPVISTDLLSAAPPAPADGAPLAENGTIPQKNPETTEEKPKTVAVRRQKKDE